MCDCEECCCGKDFMKDFEEEFSKFPKEDLADIAIEGVSEGEDLKELLLEMYDIGYKRGKQDLARESVEFYQDVLDEDDIDE